MSFSDRIKLLCYNNWFWVTVINLFAHDYLIPGAVVVGALVTELFWINRY